MHCVVFSFDSSILLWAEQVQCFMAVVCVCIADLTLSILPQSDDAQGPLFIPRSPPSRHRSAGALSIVRSHWVPKCSHLHDTPESLQGETNAKYSTGHPKFEKFERLEGIG